MSANHTPGPWSRNIAPASRYPVIFASRNTYVALVASSGLAPVEIEANCDLIAAAPELLAALSIAVFYLKSPLIPEIMNAGPVIAACEAAMARAEGKTA